MVLHFRYTWYSFNETNIFSYFTRAKLIRCSTGKGSRYNPLTYYTMTKTYECDQCHKVFGQKNDHTRHTNKKGSCVSLAQVQATAAAIATSTDGRSGFVQTFKGCLNLLRDNEGLTGEKALRNLSYLLILMLLEPHIGKDIDIDGYQGYDFGSHFTPETVDANKTRLLQCVRFSVLAKEKEDNIHVMIGYMWKLVLSVHPITKCIFTSDEMFGIKHQSTYRKLFEKLSRLNLHDTEHDVLGGAYEEVIQGIMTGKVLGQFFTPPSIKKFMVGLVEPKLHADGTIDTFGDPAMGTGGFLTTYMQNIMGQSVSSGVAVDWDFIKNHGIWGKELEPDTYKLAVSNMLISSGHMFGGLECGDSIRTPSNRKFDTILANPPFGIKGLKYDDFNYSGKSTVLPIKTDIAVLLFIQSIVHSLNIGGKCAVVLPDGKEMFSKSNIAMVAVREFLVKTCDLKEVVYLPSGIFTYTSIKTCILYFVKREEGAAVLTTDCCVSKTTQKETGRTYSFVPKHQTETVRFYEYNPYEETKLLLVAAPIDELAKNKYSFNYTEYLEDAVEPECREGVVMRTLGDVCDFDIGGTPARNNDTYYNDGTNIWVSVRELNGGYIHNSTEKITDLGVRNSSVKLFQPETVLFSFKLSIGKTAMVGTPLYTNEAIAGINSKDNIILLNRFVYYYMTVGDFTTLGSGVIGKGSLNKTSLSQIPIPVPSMERQREIVEYMDLLHDTSIVASQTKIRNLRRMNECIMTNQTATGDNEMKSLGDVCDVSYGTRIVKATTVAGEFPVFGSGKATFSSTEYNREGFTILVGRFALSAECVRFTNSQIFLNDSGLSIKPTIKSNILHKYLGYHLRNIQDTVYKCARGTAQKNLDITLFKLIPIPIPSVERQCEIVEYCDANDGLIVMLEKEIDRTMTESVRYMNEINPVVVEPTVEPIVRPRLVVRGGSTAVQISAEKNVVSALISSL